MDNEQTTNLSSIIKSHLIEHRNLIEELIDCQELPIQNISRLLIQAVSNGGTIFWCGNGGSAADSQHLAAEMVGKFERERNPIKSIALTTDTSILTSISNDYSFENIFSRQLQALATSKDVLICITTSGNSRNILKALEVANSMGMLTIGFLGKSGGEASNLVRHKFVVPSSNTARIQEIHILLGHIICDIVESTMAQQN